MREAGAGQLRPGLTARELEGRGLVEGIALGAVAGLAGALRLGGGPLQRGADLLGLDLDDAAALAGVLVLPGARLEPADDQRAVALGQRVGRMLGELPPAVDPEEGGLAVLPLVAFADAGGDGQAEVRDGGAVGGEPQLGVVGEVADQGDERVGHCCPLLGALVGAGAGPTTSGRAAGPRVLTRRW